MKMTKKVVGALLAAAVLLIGSVSAFAAPSPTAKAVIYTATSAINITAVDISDATAEAPEKADHLAAAVTTDTEDDEAIFAKAATDGTIVAECDIAVYWVDAEGNYVADYTGDCTVTITYDAKEGDVILHEKADKTVEELATTVVAGKSASAKVSSRSPFAVLRKTTATNGSSNGSSSSQVLGAQVNMMTYVIIIAGLVACAAVLGSVVVLRKRQ